MVSLDDAVVARLDSHGHRFEVLVDPDRAQAIKDGRGKVEVKADDLVIDKVFKDSSKGDEASDVVLEESFGTTDVLDVALKILLKGDIQLTTDQRRAMVEKKRRAIVAYLSRNALDPQTGSPHPPQRIENAMADAKLHVDPFKPTEEQVQDVLKAIRPLIPIRVEQVKIFVHIPAEYAGAAYGVVRETGTLVKDEWRSDGSWAGVIELPAGLQQDFYDELNKRTHGNAETRLER